MSTIKWSESALVHSFGGESRLGHDIRMRRLESHPAVVVVERYPDIEGNAVDGDSLKFQRVAEGQGGEIEGLPQLKVDTAIGSMSFGGSSL